MGWAFDQRFQRTYRIPPPQINLEDANAKKGIAWHRAVQDLVPIRARTNSVGRVKTRCHATRRAGSKLALESWRYL